MPDAEIEATMAALSGEQPPSEPAPEKAAPAEGAPKETAAAQPPNAGASPGPDKKPEAEPAAEPAAGGEKPAPEAARGGAAYETAYGALKTELGDLCRSAEQLRLQLADAHAFYDILNGKAEPGPMLDLVREMNPKTYEKIRAHFGAGPDAAKPEEAKPQPESGKTPDGKPTAEERLDRIEREAQEKQANEQRRRATESFLTKVKQLGGDAKLGERRIERFADHISAAIGRDRAALKRLEAGNYVDVERLFNALHSEFLEDLQAHNKGLEDSKRARDRALPRTPAGGAPPAADAPRKPKTAEERIAAVTQELTQ